MKMRSEPGAYGQLGLSDLLEMREDCLREFRFTDVYRCSPDVPQICGLYLSWLAHALCWSGVRLSCQPTCAIILILIV